MSISRGERREQKLSREFHFRHLPVLACARVLRQRGLGQCDLVRFIPGRRLLEIWEVKGRRAAQLSWGQEQRLRRSGIFLAKLLGASALVRVVGSE